jgi:hypothetical protein
VPAAWPLYLIAYLAAGLVVVPLARGALRRVDPVGYDLSGGNDWALLGPALTAAVRLVWPLDLALTVWLLGWAGVRHLARRYLLARYGPVGALRPPLGWSPSGPRPGLKRRARYVVASRVWRLECALHRWCGPLPGAWEGFPCP